MKPAVHFPVLDGLLVDIKPGLEASEGAESALRAKVFVNDGCA